VTVPNGDEAAELGFDELVTRLREVVDRLEQGNLGLEESLQAYELGVGLARRGHELLDNAEKRVELLVKAARGDGDEPVTEPLDAEDSDDE
jgi:exodeoxyribonuclease VII small subunit